MKYLKGFYVLLSEPETFRTGQIVMASEEAMLVKFDHMCGCQHSWSYPMELVCIDEMMHEVCENGRVWGFFESRDDLNAYLAWVNSGDEPRDKIVSLVRKDIN